MSHLLMRRIYECWPFSFEFLLRRISELGISFIKISQGFREFYKHSVGFSKIISQHVKTVGAFVEIQLNSFQQGLLAKVVSLVKALNWGRRMDERNMALRAAFVFVFCCCYFCWLSSIVFLLLLLLLFLLLLLLLLLFCICYWLLSNLPLSLLFFFCCIFLFVSFFCRFF